MNPIQIRRVFAIFVVLLFTATLVRAQERDQQPRINDDKCGMTKTVLYPLIDEAGFYEFNTRRVEIAGNTYTRGREFWKRMVEGLREGDIFTRRALEESVMRVSKIKSIYPISMENIEVRLDRKNKAIDIVFCIKQKPKK